MPTRKAKTRKANATPQQEVAEVDATRTSSMIMGFFPYARYTSIVGVHTTLLAFSALFLPRTTTLVELMKPQWDLDKKTSQDRPQHPFMEALTISPILTLACMCVGVAVLQGWWGGWIRSWWITYSLEGTIEEKKMEGRMLNQRRLTVRMYCACVINM